MSNEIPTSAPAPAIKRWQPLSAIDRRVLGVLGEKAKTTPDAYPMSLNAIVTGCNQKSNRAPLMQLEPEDVEESLDRLRQAGAAAMVEGYGRVTKYRHYLYEWLGVDKVELSVMIELLLRGAQTEGELRGRASRMDPIADLQALRTLLDALAAKGLVLSLTPDGRGHVVSHALYLPRELDHLRTQYAPAAMAAADPSPAGPIPRPPAADRQAARSDARTEEMAELRAQLSGLRAELETLQERFTQVEDQLGQLRAALGG